MNRVIRAAVFALMALIVFGGNAWGGWFSFEPNLKLRDGTPVARYLEDLEAEIDYLAKGDTAQADQLLNDQKVYVIKEGQDMTRVEFKGYEEHQGKIFIQVQDESGTKVWASITGLASVDPSGQEKELTKQDVEKGDFKPLP